MIFLQKFIDQFQAEGSKEKAELGTQLAITKAAYDVHNGGDPVAAFPAFADRYNWLGDRPNKARYGITENLARNLPGAMFQDYLLHLICSQLLYNLV